MHTQQNSHLHFLHVMCLPLACGSRQAINIAHLQPPFFSIVDWHLVHSFVFACSQFAVSESSMHFFSHTLTTLHRTGLWLLA